MWNIDRRVFLNGSLCTIAAAMLPYRAFGLGLSTDASQDPSSDQYSPETLFLTWKEDPTTTMVIQWIGPETTADMSVRYSELSAADNRVCQTIVKPYSTTELKVFRAEVKGLQPGTEYKFQIGNAFPSYRFRTMPSKINDEFRFVTGGDAGISDHAVATNRLAAAQNPNFVLIAGDLAYDDGKSPEIFYQFLKNYSSAMFDAEHRLIPLIGSIGNHEVLRGYGAKRSEAPQYLSLFDVMYPEVTYASLDFGDYLSLVLTDTGHIAPVIGEQTSWLEQTLKERQDFPHLMVANHVPCYPSYRPPQGTDGGKGVGEDQRNYWCPLFERYKVDVVLEHHDHTFKRTHPLTGGMHDTNGIVYLGDGSWGKLRVPKTPDERPYLAKVESAYHMTLHSLQGDSRFHIAITDDARIADVYATYRKRPSRRG